MNRPTWDNFIAVNSGDKQASFEALARMLFKAKYNLKDNLAYFKNHAGNETDTITVNGSVIGFQAKYFEGSINKTVILDSMRKAKANNPLQTDYCIYTNASFGNPRNGKPMTDAQKEIEDEANTLGLVIEWWFGDNILDAASRDSLIGDLFFNTEINLRDLHTHICTTNDLYFAQICSSITSGNKEYRFDRGEIVRSIENSIRAKKNIIISGESGSGKSALMKIYYESNKKADEIAFYIVNAAQLDTNAVNDVFNLQEAYTIVNFARFYQDCKTKLLVVDSAEKLMSNTRQLAFSLLVNDLMEKGWRFVFTCRQNSQLELNDFLSSKMSMQVCSINVPSISDEELRLFAKSHNIILPTDKKLYSRLTTPFYLARYCELQIHDTTRLTLKTFRDEVWNQKVRGGLHSATGQYREDCLLSIIEDQISNNRYYTPKSGIDHGSAYNLIVDDILVDNGIRGYSIKHDLYAEWASDYLTETKYESCNRNVVQFIEKLGETQTSINAFGRWFDSKIEETDTKVFVEVVDILFNNKLSNNWQQVVIKSICSSKIAAQPFFNQYKDTLIAEDYKWLNKFISVMSVSCQEVEGYFTYEGNTYPSLRPIGGCWEACVILIDEIADSYYMKNLKFVYVVLNNCQRTKTKDSEVMARAAKLSLRVFDEIAEVRKKDGYLKFEKPDSWCQLVCDYAIYAKDEIHDRLKQVIDNKWFEHGDPYFELVKYISTTTYQFHLMGLAVSNMDIFLTLLEELWFYHKPADTNNPWHTNSTRYRESEWHCGLNEDFLAISTYLPASALQTPALMLMKIEDMMATNTHKVIDLLIRIINRSANVYKSRPIGNDTISMSTIGLPKGGSKSVISSCCLWNLYRASSGLAMPYLLESIHMALEKYLLGLMEEKGVNNTEKVRSYLHLILEEAESCSLIAIVASLVCAYPDKFYEESLLLMKDIRLLEMDMMRSNREISISGLDFAYNNHKDMWQERKESRELRHRKIQLENLLTNYQVIYDGKKSDEEAERRLQQLYAIVDNLKEQVASMPKDEQGLLGFTIARIDYKNMKHEKVVLENNVEAIQITPNLTKEQQEDSDRVMKQSQEMTRGISLRYWVENKYKGIADQQINSPFEGNISAIFDVIDDIKMQLKNYPHGITMLVGDEFLPAMACALLLIQYKEELSGKQLKTCHDEVSDALTSEEFMMSSPLSGFEICLDSIPTLITLFPKEKEKWAQIILTYASKRHETGNYRACDKVRAMISKCKLWDEEPQFMEDVVATYLNFVEKENHGLDDIEVAETLFSLIPSGTKNEKIRSLAIDCVTILAGMWKEDEAVSYRSGDKFYVSYQVAEYILRACDEDIKPLAYPFVQYLRPDEHYDSLLSAFIIECCEHNLYVNFWKVWDVFYEAMTAPIPSHYPAQELRNYLLNPDFLHNNIDDSWFHFEKKDLCFYRKVANDIGRHPVVLYSIVKAFTTFAKAYYDESISIVHSIIIQDGLNIKEYETLVNHHLEKIMQRVFTEIPDRIKDDVSFRQQLIDILHFMLNHESQMASQFLSNF